MKIGEQPVHGLKGIAGMNKQVAPAGSGRKPPRPGAAFQDPDAGGAHGYDAFPLPPGGIELMGRGPSEFEILGL